MPLILACLAIISLFEFSIWLPGIWQWHKQLSPLIALLIVAASAVLIIKNLNGWTLLIAFVILYRLINLWRLFKDRTQTDYLYLVTRRTSAWLVGSQVLIAGLAGLSHLAHIHPRFWLYELALLQAVAAVSLLITAGFNLFLTRPPHLKPATDSQLPSLTVAIPARNETDDLQACLESLVGSDYPKLEILVLDDCSQNKQTPEIIQSFAHAGVRFIAGQAPPEHWLAKNYAYHQLAEASSGELLLFCGVDTRYEAGSLRAMVGALQQTKKSLVSFVPSNLSPTKGQPLSLLLQPSRYAWELILPRHWLKRPPILSTCWLITKELLKNEGGFKTVNHSGSPESYFARAAMRQNGYSFLQSNTEIGLVSAKSFSEQRDTAIRTRYLQAHRKPEVVALISLLEIGLIIGPPALLIVGIVTGAWWLVAACLFSTAVLGWVFADIMELTYRKFTFNSLWLFLPAAVYDVSLLNYSMWQYEFGEVIWKGRNICIPVMRSRSLEIGNKNRKD